MKIREKIGYWFLILHIKEVKWVPNNDETHTGTAYFKIDRRWYNFVRKLSGIRPELLIKKAARCN